MTKPIEVTDEQLNAILNSGRQPTPLHTVVDDSRLRPFMSIEDFAKKWNLEPEKRSE